ICYLDHRDLPSFPTRRSSDLEFLYKNEVIKFRDIAMRGPWTSGGIEFNFGIIGHSPATATPVDYRTKKNDDGSVSCIVGNTDLRSEEHTSELQSRENLVCRLL